jgi:hypothetical protein
MASCWNSEPAKRPSFACIKSQLELMINPDGNEESEEATESLIKTEFNTETQEDQLPTLTYENMKAKSQYNTGTETFV